MSTTIHHGSYYMESPLDDLNQVEYGCSHCEDECQGFMEILHVENPPHGRLPFLVHYRMYFPERYTRTGTPVLLRLEICCRDRRTADRVWKELSKLWGDLNRLSLKLTIAGQNVRTLGEDELPWVYEENRSTYPRI